MNRQARAWICSLTPLIAGCVVAIIWGWYYFPSLETKTVFILQKWLVAAFFLNSSIIFANTFSWAMTEFTQDGKGNGRIRKLLACFGIAALFLCGAEWTFWWQFMKQDYSVNNDWDKALFERLHTSEGMSLGIFMIFAVIDMLALKEMKDSKKKDSNKIDFYKRSILIVDLPVVLIVSIVLCAQNLFFEAPNQVTEHGVRYFGDLLQNVMSNNPAFSPAFSTYSKMIEISFAVGAILGHIMLSQLAFAYLRWEYLIRSSR